ncbi:translation initiation factor eIF-2B subunit beta-like protein [Sarcoptes scabiei]|uniref:Translation initiation factor eIF2B subunit beta n=1 Tax=Sarcoptes scabiei TaxID=52283 RepID=A0A132A0W4_SARSC|nr:translation initiation factor eIF-2B subunit beta-like protein [Sarcoptes scabiei]
MEIDQNQGSKTLNQFINLLKYKPMSSYELAKKTVLFLQDFLISNEWKTPKEIIEKIQSLGKTLIKIQPTESVIDNMTRRILKIIRDDINHCLGIQDSDGFESILNMPSPVETIDASNKIDMDELKDAIGISLVELLSELDTSNGNITAQSLEHIYWDEVIMTIGRSKTVEAFLKSAAKKKRKFQVIIAECSPQNNGHELATSLDKENIKTVLIHDSAIFAVMSRVNKVIIGTHTIMANGGIKAVSGAYTLALAAKHYSVPFIVCTGLFKLAPHHLISYDQLAFNKFASPDEILNYENSFSTEIQIINPIFDYVPPELITIFVSNM